MTSAGERPLRLRLFVAGSAPNSMRALRNVRALQDRLASLAVELEVVDVFVQPSEALDANVLLTPMLALDTGPSSPPRYIVGTLDDYDAVEAALGLAGSI